jgi:hypothetical protein
VNNIKLKQNVQEQVKKAELAAKKAIETMSTTVNQTKLVQANAATELVIQATSVLRKLVK